MQNYKNSDYALNKDSKSIVYDFADSASELTVEKFLAENPSMTEADFLFWKQLSDEDYLDRWRDEYKQTWKDVPIDTLSEEPESTAPSPDEVIEAPEVAAQRAKRTVLGMSIWKKLTKDQQRRFHMYYVDGLTVRQIADIEGVAHQSIVECLAGAKRKIEKNLKNF